MRLRMDVWQVVFSDFIFVQFLAYTFTSNTMKYSYIFLIFILQTLAYSGFCEIALQTWTPALGIVDECGNLWQCDLVFETRPYTHFIVGGGFSIMLLARRLCEGTHVMVGAPEVGSNHTLFFRVIRRQEISCCSLEFRLRYICLALSPYQLFWSLSLYSLVIFIFQCCFVQCLLEGCLTKLNILRLLSVDWNELLQ